MSKLRTCRCCLKELGSEEELHEFSSEVATDLDAVYFNKISDCYWELTALVVPENEEDSTKICSNCLGDLKFSVLFKRKCLESAKILENEEQEIDEIQEPHDHEVDSLKVEEEEPYDYVVEELVESQQESLDGDQEMEEVEEEEDEENDSDGNESKYLTSYVPAKRSRMENLEPEDGMIYNCELCPKTFDRKEYYRRHFRRTHVDKIILDEDTKKPLIFQCDFCGKISTSRSDYEEHQNEHEGEPRFKCRKCEKSFASKEEARTHLTTAHSLEDKPYACETCSKSFKNRYQLILHNRTHTGEKPFQCPVCERAFSMSSNLQKHLDTHSTEKPYHCSYCNQYFKTQRSLKFHTVCHHQPEVKVKCPTCDKSFVNKSYLKVHMLYHTGEKNFTCIICNSKYYKSSHLKRHIQNVHFKLRLMKCGYCTSDFVRKETYKAHIISHHKRHMSDQEFLEVLDNIRKFQPPHLDINQFTVEKQNSAKAQKNPTFLEEIDEVEMEEMIEDEIEKSDEGLVEAGDEYEIFEEEEEVGDNSED